MSEPSSHRSARFIGAILAGRYRASGVLSESASGALLSAEDDLDGKKRVAIRVIYPEAAKAPEVVAALEREAAVVGRIAHPAIAACRRAGIAEDGSTLLLLPDLGGPTIREVGAGGRVALARAAVIAKQLALALEKLHEAGVIHRALSPDCVRVVPATEGDHEDVRITDFSFAQLDDESSAPKLEGESAAAAAAYAAPEALAGGKVDGRADFYALGLMFYEMATGSRPSPERSASLPTVTSIRSVPVAVDALALRLLADDPERRAAIAMEVVQALDALADPPPPPLPKRGAPGPSAASGGGTPAGASGSSGSASSSNSSPRRPPSAKSAAESMTAPAVTVGSIPSSSDDDSSPPVLFRRLREAPREVRFYFGGVVAIVLLLVFAVLVRSPTVDGEEAAPDDRASSASPVAEGLGADAPASSAQGSSAAWEIRDRMEKSVRIGNMSAFVADVERLLEVDPAAANDRDLRGTIIDVLMRIMVGGGADAEKLFGIIENKMGTGGPDLLFELMTTKGGSRAAKRAEEMLRDAGLRSRGTPALRIAYDLRVTSGCEEKAALLERAKDEGDRRTLGQLQALNQDCRRGECCLANDPNLKAAIEGIKERLK